MKKVLISGMLGNGLEWYDFAIYGQLAYILSTLFFPTENPTASLLATYSVFAVGFFFRPLGAVLFGWIGDRYGRKISLVIAILMMAIPTGLMGLLPTYAQIGILAPILLTLLRIFQGLSLGGEFSGSIVYIVEHAPPHRRALAGSASMISMIMGFMAGTLTVLAAKSMMSLEDFEAWGWRIPFVCGIVVGLVGFYIRSKCHESPVYEEAKASGGISATPVREAFSAHPVAMLQGFGMYLAVTMPFYLMAIYMITYMKTELNQPIQAALTINLLAMFAMMFGMMKGAVLADMFGRKKVLMPVAGVMALLAVPMFLVMDTQTFVPILVAQAVFCFVLGMYLGPIPAVLVELFPTRVRYTGMSLAYNAAAALFGGTTPLVCVWLIKHTGTHVAIPAYVVLCCILSIIALKSYTDRWREPLR